jgi:rare lipoprotein A
MKKKYVFLFILFLSVFVTYQLEAQGTEIFRQEGIASWYGREFEGRPTASGEIFDSSELTAAHPSLPFGTKLVVTNQHNKKSVTVRVNDRGPFVPARIIDVSRAAAEQLDMIVTGTAPVTVESVDKIVMSAPVLNTQMTAPVITAPSAAYVVTTPVQTAPVIQTTPAQTVPVTPGQAALIQTAPVIQSAPVTAVPSEQIHTAPVFVSQPVVLQTPIYQIKITPEINVVSVKNYRLQVGSFKNAKNAVEAFDRLKASGLSPNYERFISGDNVEYYRVVVAGVRGDNVQFAAERIGAAGFKEAIIKEEN